jgi:hypothetical protein
MMMMMMMMIIIIIIIIMRMTEPLYSSLRRGMAEAFNAADHLTGDCRANPTSCPMHTPTGVQKIMMIDLAYEHVTATFFFMYC